MIGETSIFQLIWIFAIYSFLGWIVDVVYHAYSHREWVNRGFLFGPFCPIYATGIFLIISLTSPFKSNLLFLFFSATIIATLVEYFTGVVLESLFHTSWWDYSQERFNLGGKICLKISIYWGLLSVFVVHDLHPLVLKISQFLVNNLTYIGALVVLAYFITDFIITLTSLYGLKHLFKLLDNLKQKYDFDVASVRQNSLFSFITLKRLKREFEKNQKLVYKEFTKHYSRFIKAFPDLKSVIYPNSSNIKKKISKQNFIQ